MPDKSTSAPKIKLYIAMSLDGFIAKPDGSVDWLHELPNPTNTDHGYADFYASITTTLMGYKTYQQILDWGIDFPYPDKTNYVFTRKQGLDDTEYVKFVASDAVKFIQQLKQEAGGDIWLVGGAQLNSVLWDAGLIDEWQVFIMPTILGQGVPMLAGKPEIGQLSLVESTAFPTGAVRLTYHAKA